MVIIRQVLKMIPRCSLGIARLFLVWFYQLIMRANGPKKLAVQQNYIEVKHPVPCSEDAADDDHGDNTDCARVCIADQSICLAQHSAISAIDRQQDTKK